MWNKANQNCHRNTGDKESDKSNWIEWREVANSCTCQCQLTEIGTIFLCACFSVNATIVLNACFEINESNEDENNACSSIATLHSVSFFPSLCRSFWLLVVVLSSVICVLLFIRPTSSWSQHKSLNPWNCNFCFVFFGWRAFDVFDGKKKRQSDLFLWIY